MTWSRRRIALCALLGITAASTPTSARAAPPSEPAGAGRVIVLGFDGADAGTATELMDGGLLPNLKRLRDAGTFAPLVSTSPAESAAGWAALNTGVDPVANGVPSFITRRLTPAGPVPDAGNVNRVTRPIDAFEHRGALRLLVSTSPLELGLGAALAGYLAGVLLVAPLLWRRRRRVPLALLPLLPAGLALWAASRARDWVPHEVPRVYTNNVTAEGFWADAARAGVPSIVLDAALAFDQPTVPGARVLAGLGVPDIRAAGHGAWFLYTTDETEIARPPRGSQTDSRSGFVFRVDERDGRVDTHLFGPVNFWERSRVQLDLDRLEASVAERELKWREHSDLREERRRLREALVDFEVNEDEHRARTPLTLERVGERVRVTIGGRSEDLAQGQWSDWFRPSFSLNPLIRVRAVTRVRLMSARDPLALYVNALEIDPSAPPFWQPISQPGSFSGDLERWLGRPFETLGWSCMTNPVKDEKVDVDVFLEDIEFTMRWREELTLAALAREDWRLLFSVFSTTDRVQHIMYRYYDVGHPLHDESEARREVLFFGERVSLAQVIPAIYRRMDAFVGRVLDECMQPEDTLFLCADHGFTSFRRGLNVNNWLAERGYLTLRPGLTRKDGESLASYPDWSRTLAYSLGFGAVYLNLQGREPAGIVPRGAAGTVLERIRQDFLAEVDPQTGARVGHAAEIMKDLYPGPWGSTDYPCADLMLGFARNYRSSWDATFGRIDLRREGDTVELGELYVDNEDAWSGDHASNAPAVVPGVFFCNRPLQVPLDGISVMHIAPTVLATLGVPVPASYRRPPLRAD